MTFHLFKKINDGWGAGGGDKVMGYEPGAQLLRKTDEKSLKGLYPMGPYSGQMDCWARQLPHSDLCLTAGKWGPQQRARVTQMTETLGSQTEEGETGQTPSASTRRPSSQPWGRDKGKVRVSDQGLGCLDGNCGKEPSRARSWRGQQRHLGSEPPTSPSAATGPPTKLSAVGQGVTKGK